MARAKKTAEKADKTTLELSLWDRIQLILKPLSVGGVGSRMLLATELLTRRIEPTAEEQERYQLTPLAPGHWSYPISMVPEMHAAIDKFELSELEMKRVRLGYQVMNIRENGASDAGGRQLMFKFVTLEQLEEWADTEDRNQRRAG